MKYLFNNADLFEAKFIGKAPLNLSNRRAYEVNIAQSLSNLGLNIEDIDLDTDCKITFDYGEGVYGIRYGFFSAVVTIKGIPLPIQCLAQCVHSVEIDFDDCSYMVGMCKYVNEYLAEVIGWEGVLLLLKRAYKEYKET